MRSSRRRQLILALAIGVVLVIDHRAGAQGISAALSEYMASTPKGKAFSGAVMVTRGGEVLLAKGYGMADIDGRVPNTPTTKYRIASLTKPFTAVAVMMLQESGKLTVGDRLDLHLPNLPEAWRGLTVHQLLSHTAGLMQPGAADRAKLSPMPTVPLQIAQPFRDQPLVAAPGEKYFYSALGYTLLAAVIEGVSGKDYATFLRERIFAPLGMKGSGADRLVLELSARAVGYAQSGGVLRSLPVPSFALIGAADLYSTIDDLHRFDQALYGEKLVSRKTLATMFTRVRSDIGYGYGFNVTESGGRLLVGHGGSTEGFATGYFRYPNEHVSMFLLSNVQGTQVPLVAQDLAALVFKH
jgi:CubicO group peptidase (beta-lactamase class C family)